LPDLFSSYWIHNEALMPLVKIEHSVLLKIARSLEVDYEQ
jgi:hypothetical protein